MRLSQKPNTLPHIVFFEPSDDFIAYLKETVPNRKVVDVGAGAGYLSRVLHGHGFKVLAIDILERDDPLYPVAMLDATEMEFPKGVTPIIARPCHSEWIELAINNAMKAADFVLYVGLEHNFSQDLGAITKRFSLTTEPFIAGNDGERVVRINRMKQI